MFPFPFLSTTYPDLFLSIIRENNLKKEKISGKNRHRNSGAMKRFVCFFLSGDKGRVSPRVLHRRDIPFFG